jgi:hypothetical protein
MGKHLDLESDRQFILFELAESLRSSETDSSCSGRWNNQKYSGISSQWFACSQSNLGTRTVSASRLEIHAHMTLINPK